MEWVSVIAKVVPTAAFVAGVVALIGHYISRANARLSAEISRDNARLAAKLEAAKFLAESRQNWINLLREEMVHFFLRFVQSTPFCGILIK